MRALVILLVLLAAAKLAFQEYLFRAATRDAVLEAYRQHAVEACQRDARNLGFGLTAQAWANPRTIQLAIGKRTGKISCEYDIVNASAAVSRM
jgi:hypothetical protein